MIFAASHRATDFHFIHFSKCFNVWPQSNTLCHSSVPLSPRFPIELINYEIMFSRSILIDFDRFAYHFWSQTLFTLNFIRWQWNTKFIIISVNVLLLCQTSGIIIAALLTVQTQCFRKMFLSFCENHQNPLMNPRIAQFSRWFSVLFYVFSYFFVLLTNFNGRKVITTWYDFSC